MVNIVLDTIVYKKQEHISKNTYSSIYLLPMLSLKSSDILGYLNTYQSCGYFEVNTNNIYVVINKNNRTLERLVKNKLFLELIETKRYYILKFNIPELFSDDYTKILNGNYLGISDAYIKNLLFYNTSDSIKTQILAYTNRDTLLYTMFREELEQSFSIEIPDGKEIGTQFNLDDERFDYNPFDPVIRRMYNSGEVLQAISSNYN